MKTERQRTKALHAGFNTKVILAILSRLIIMGMREEVKAFLGSME